MFIDTSKLYQLILRPQNAQSHEVLPNTLFTSIFTACILHSRTHTARQLHLHASCQSIFYFDCHVLNDLTLNVT